MDIFSIPDLSALFCVFFFLTGLTFGSFANVCVYRLPLNLSVVRPRSRCPVCKKQIEWYDNIPLLSYLLLGGKCRGCKTKISPAYPVVELITGVSFAVLFYFYGMTPAFFLFIFMAFCLVVVSAIDYYHRIIPDIFPLMLLAAGLLVSFFNASLGETALRRFISSALGFLAGGGSLFLIGIAGRLLFKQEAMGGGDVKLMAGVGAVIGWERVLLSIFIASFLGSIIGIFLIITKKVERKGYIPFGPFLAAASYITLLMPAPSIMINLFFVWETGLINKLFGA